MRLCLKKMITSDIAYHIAISLVCFIILVLVVTPSCSATSGKVIVFYRENIIGVNDVGNDVGHVGVAIQLEDGTWLAGAIEGPGGSQGVTGTSDDTSYNGGWAHVFKTEEEVIKELADSRETESGDIGAHAAYTKMKQITVPEINEKNFEDAEDEMKGFENSGFSIWKNNDCYTRVWDVMESYGVDVGVLRDYDGLISVGDKDWLRQPQDFFQDLLLLLLSSFLLRKL